MNFDDELKSKLSMDIKPKIEERVDASNSVVIGEATLLNLRLFGAIKGGNAVFPLGNNKALKLTRGPDFQLGNGRPGHNVIIQVLDAGIGKSIKTQSYQATKKIKEVVIKEVEKQETFEIKQKVLDI